MSNPSRQQSDEPRRQRLHALQLALLCAVVAGVTIFAHWPVMSAQAASFDDEEAIILNRLIQTPSWNSVGRFFSEVTLSSVVRGYYRPLTLTSFMLDWAMGGRPDDFRIFHRTSLALHVGSTILLIVLCYQVFRQPLIAALAGLLFGVHPLAVEPIAWVMERKTLLATFFAFACLIAYVRYTQHTGKRWLAASTFLFLLSLLAKPTGTPLPIIMLLMDIWPLKRLGRSGITCGSNNTPSSGNTCETTNTCGTGILPVRLTGWKPVPHMVLEKIPFFILAAVFAVLCMICEQKVNPLSLPAKLSPLHLPLRLCWLTVFYPCKILLPINLSSVYMLPDPLSLANGWVLSAVVGTLLMAAALVVSSRWTPAFWTTAAIFYVGLAPTMGFVGYSWVAASDKYAYLPAVGPVLLLCWLLQRIWLSAAGGSARPRQAAIVVAVLICAGLLTIGTRKYLRHWQTTDRLTALHVKLAPKSAEAQYQRGKALHDKGDLDAAIQSYTRAIELKSYYAEAFNNRANAYSSLGDNARAFSDYNKAIQLRPDYAEAFNNRGTTFSEARAFDRAIADCTRAIELKPEYAEAYTNRGAAHLAVQVYDRAIADCTKAIELRPDMALAYNNRGNAYLALGDHDRASSDYRKAISLEPNRPEAYHNLAVIHFLLKQYDQAWENIKLCRQYGGTPSPDFLRDLGKASGTSE